MNDKEYLEMAFRNKVIRIAKLEAKLDMAKEVLKKNYDQWDTIERFKLMEDNKHIPMWMKIHCKVALEEIE